jgi:hypothetical protein
MQKFEFKRYAKLLGEWVVFARRDLYHCPDAEGLICYGPGLSTNWGMQTHMKALSAFAVAASLDDIDFRDQLSHKQVFLESLSMLRYVLRTHLTGDYVCTNGEKWGHSWIYALGIERMFHAIEILWDVMTENDKELLKILLTSESDFLLDEYEIVAGTVQNNKPESNIWNGALLYRTAELYPELPRANEYIEKAQRFFANGISIESDEDSDEIVSGRRIGDMFVGANMFNSYACNHHRYLNVGYMNICISNIAMLHFFMKGRGKRCDDIVYHHLYDQWRLIRSTTFDDGRLVRIGGDTRVRYSYCQDYALPAWSLIEDVYGEDCSGLENGWLEKLEREFKANGDGSFVSDRCGYFEEYSTVYYTRLETDRANSISLALWWHKKFNLDCNGKCDTIPIWRDEYHGAAFIRGEKRFASFSWRAAAQPTALMLPMNESDLAEWRYNMSGRVVGIGTVNADDVESNVTETFEGGFITYGTAIPYTDKYVLAEGMEKESLARKYISFAALPDDATVISIQHATAINRARTVETAALTLSVPNDIFNGSIRRIVYNNGEMTLHGGGIKRELSTHALGGYVSVDEKIAIASAEPLTLVRREGRQIGLKDTPNMGTLYCEEICSSYKREKKTYGRGDEIFTAHFAASIGGNEAAKALSESLTIYDDGNIKSVSVLGQDGKRYLLIANSNEKATIIDVKEYCTGDAVNLKNGENVDSLTLNAWEAVLLRIK